MDQDPVARKPACLAETLGLKQTWSLQAKKSILPLADRGPAAQKPLLAKPSGRGRERDSDRALPVSGG